MRIDVVRDGGWLVVELGEPCEMLSSAIVGGGRRRASTVAWCAVDGRELAPPVDARSFLVESLAERGISGAVGFMTSSDLDRYVAVDRSAGDHSVHVIATVGLGNALRAGDPTSGMRIGTINILCALSASLSEEALVETVALVAEARTAAVLDAGVPSTRSGLAATGTGTDCIVVAAAAGGSPLEFAGKHTSIGYLVGDAVGEAVRRGAAGWKARQGAK